jgi:hypothetical protein
MDRYYINGWREGKNHFWNLLNGRITEEQKQKLENGEEIVVNENTFYIEKEGL